MRILWLSHFLPYPPKGGLLQRSHYLLREAARRHPVTLVALNQRGLLSTSDAVEDAVAALRPLVEDLAWFEIPADRSRLRWGLTAAASYFRRDPFDINWLESRAMRQYLTRRIARERFDLVHVDTLGLLPYADRQPQIPIVLNHHNIESQMMTRRQERESSVLRRKYFRREAKKLSRLERTACPAVAANLVVSSLDADRLRLVAPRATIHVVPNGVDTEYFRPGGSAVIRPGSLIFVGGMNWYPNRDAVLYFLREVWPLLRDEPGERTLTVVGQNPPAELLAATDDSRIRAPGFVDDVRPYLEQADVYVCPIRDGGGTRLKILDALAMAKPLVATAVAVEGLGLTEDFHYLRAESPHDYVRQIRKLEGDPDLRRHLGVAGRGLVEARYRWPAVGEELEAAYASTVQHYVA
jgi:glycosyltransferase involved in cell wall biosynthesis